MSTVPAFTPVTSTGRPDPTAIEAQLQPRFGNLGGSAMGEMGCGTNGPASGPSRQAVRPIGAEWGAGGTRHARRDVP